MLVTVLRLLKFVKLTILMLGQYRTRVPRFLCPPIERFLVSRNEGGEECLHLLQLITRVFIWRCDHQRISLFAELFCFNNDNNIDVNVDYDWDVLIIDATRLQECYCHVLLGITLITFLLVYFCCPPPMEQWKDYGRWVRLVRYSSAALGSSGLIGLVGLVRPWLEILFLFR